MLWPDDVTDEQLALAAAKCDEDEQTREGNSYESFVFRHTILTRKYGHLWQPIFLPFGYGRFRICIGASIWNDKYPNVMRMNKLERVIAMSHLAFGFRHTILK
jgi:hypothetical protein